MVLLGIMLGWVMVSGFGKNAVADSIIAERISMQMAESSGLMKEMARKTDAMARKTDEMSKANSIYFRMILERVDKNR